MSKDAQLSYSKLMRNYTSPYKAEEFPNIASSIIFALKEALDIKLKIEVREDAKPLERHVMQTLQLHNSGDFENRDLELRKLVLLLLDIQKVKDYDLNSFRSLRRTFVKANKLSQYIGYRFEFRIAALLTEKNIDFSSQESPDFLIKQAEGNCYIETTSVHMPEPKPYNMYLKVGAQIDNKSKKPYANENTILMIDISNIIHSAAMFKSEFSVESLPEKLQEHIKNSSYGAFYFYAIFPKEHNGTTVVTLAGNCHIKENASKELLTLMKATEWDKTELQEIEHGTSHSM